MKRMLRYAAENGYDKLAWTTGEQQADRYALGGVVRKIQSYVNDDGTRHVMINFKSGNGLTCDIDGKGEIVATSGHTQGIITEGQSLSEVVGKELAQKIIDGKGDVVQNKWVDDREVRELSGETLRLGGEGMRGFYDEILPRFMNKYGKKWGVKVYDIELPNVEEAGRHMWAVDITPEMKESVMKGQVMFSKEDEEFNRQIDGLNEKNKDNIVLSLGRPSKILVDAGVQDKPMKLYGNKLLKKQKKHGFKLEELYNLPSAVADPIAVFNNYKTEGNRSVLTELKTKNGNFLVSVELGKDGDVDFNVVLSVFGKGGDRIEDWFKRGYSTYINEKKVKDFLSHQSAPIAAAAAKSSPYLNTKVRKLFELNKLFGEKLFIRTNNFKKWFGEWEKEPEKASKVVDEKGEPLVVYHDTNSTIWRNRETGENFDDLDWKQKQYRQEEASQEEWEKNWQEEDFYTFDNTQHGRQSVEVPGFFFSPTASPYHEYGKRRIAAYLNIKNPIIDPEIPNRGVTDTAGRDAIEEWIRQGYDGMIRTDGEGHIEEYVAFYPEQIKSATTNNGDYSKNNPDI